MIDEEDYHNAGNNNNNSSNDNEIIIFENINQKKKRKYTRRKLKEVEIINNINNNNNNNNSNISDDNTNINNEENNNNNINNNQDKIIKKRDKINKFDRLNRKLSLLPPIYPNSTRYFIYTVYFRPQPNSETLGLIFDNISNRAVVNGFNDNFKLQYINENDDDRDINNNTNDDLNKIMRIQKPNYIKVHDILIAVNHFDTRTGSNFKKLMNMITYKPPKPKYTFEKVNIKQQVYDDVLCVKFARPILTDDNDNHASNANNNVVIKNNYYSYIDSYLNLEKSNTSTNQNVNINIRTSLSKVSPDVNQIEKCAYVDVTFDNQSYNTVNQVISIAKENPQQDIFDLNDNTNTINTIELTNCDQVISNSNLTMYANESINISNNIDQIDEVVTTSTQITKPKSGFKPNLKARTIK